MNIHDAIERAYKNGYERGKKDAISLIVRCEDCVFWRRNHDSRLPHDEGICIRQPICAPATYKGFWCARGRHKNKEEQK